MAAKAIPVDMIPSIDPATGQILAQFEKTLPAALAGNCVASPYRAIRMACASLRETLFAAALSARSHDGLA